MDLISEIVLLIVFISNILKYCNFLLHMDTPNLNKSYYLKFPVFDHTLSKSANVHLSMLLINYIDNLLISIFLYLVYFIVLS